MGVVAIELPGAAAGLATLWASVRDLMRGPTGRLMRQVQTQLPAHLESIGVRVEVRKARNVSIRRRESRDSVVIMHLLAHARVWLKGVDSVEVWRVITKARDGSTVVDEISYVAELDPTLTLTRIPILTNAVRAQTDAGRTTFYWSGFEWGNVPLLAHRLEADEDLNSRLLRHFNTDVPGDLRITAYPNDRVGITTDYDAQRPPTREFLSCIEHVINHVNEYVAERNRARDAFVSRWQPG